MNNNELIKKHLEEIVEFAVTLTKEHKDICEGWHDDICMRNDGSMYHTGLINGGTSTEVFNGDAFKVYAVCSGESVDSKIVREHIKDIIEMNELHGEQ